MLQNCILRSNIDKDEKIRQMKEAISVNKAVFKQTIRDLASKNTKLSDDAKLFIQSKHFSEILNRLGIEQSSIDEALKQLSEYPIVTRKKVADQMARMLDSSRY